MKLRVFLLLSLLCVANAWANTSAQKAHQMRSEAELTYFSVESVREAYKDFCKTKGYDAQRYGALLAEFFLGDSGGISPKFCSSRKACAAFAICCSNPFIIFQFMFQVVQHSVQSGFHCSLWHIQYL